MGTFFGTKRGQVETSQHAKGDGWGHLLQYEEGMDGDILLAWGPVGWGCKVRTSFQCGDRMDGWHVETCDIDIG